MGWQDRDWARLNESEKRSLYGYAPTVSLRHGVALAAVVTLAASGVTARVLRPTLFHAGPGLGPVPTVYGAPIVGPDGHDDVCTEFRAVGGRWSCVSFLSFSRTPHITQPAPYPGPCSDLRVDPSARRWVCLAPGSLPMPAPAQTS